MEDQKPSSEKVLPDEIMIEIFSFLTTIELKSVGSVCRRFYCSSRSDFLWEKSYAVNIGNVDKVKQRVKESSCKSSKNRPEDCVSQVSYGEIFLLYCRSIRERSEILKETIPNLSKGETSIKSFLDIFRKYGFHVKSEFFETPDNYLHYEKILLVLSKEMSEVENRILIVSIDHERLEIPIIKSLVSLKKVGSVLTSLPVNSRKDFISRLFFPNKEKIVHVPFTVLVEEGYFIEKKKFLTLCRTFAKLGGKLIKFFFLMIWRNCNQSLDNLVKYGSIQITRIMEWIRTNFSSSTFNYFVGISLKYFKGQWKCSKGFLNYVLRMRSEKYSEEVLQKVDVFQILGDVGSVVKLLNGIRFKRNIMNAVLSRLNKEILSDLIVDEADYLLFFNCIKDNKVELDTFVNIFDFNQLGRRIFDYINYVSVARSLEEIKKLDKRKDLEDGYKGSLWNRKLFLQEYGDREYFLEGEVGEKFSKFDDFGKPSHLRKDLEEPPPKKKNEEYTDTQKKSHNLFSW